jgi:oligopeptidase B
MVPFLDTVTTEMDVTIPWAQWEWLEWGSPYDRDVYDYMMSYSPYDNIGQVPLKSFPNVMVTSGLYDPRVKYYEPTKFVAKLRHHIANQSRIGNLTTIPRVVLVTENAGHFGPSSLDGYVAAQAYMFAYVLDAIIPPTSGILSPHSSIIT